MQWTERYMHKSVRECHKAHDARQGSRWKCGAQLCYGPHVCYKLHPPCCSLNTHITRC